MALVNAFLKHHGGLEKNRLDRVLQQHNNDESTGLRALHCLPPLADLFIPTPRILFNLV